MTTEKEKKTYINNINESVNLKEIEERIDQILQEEKFQNSEKFREEWDEVQKMNVIMQGYKKEGEKKEEEEKKEIDRINWRIERKIENIYFEFEENMSNIEEKIGENYSSISKLSEHYKELSNLENVTKILEYEEGASDIKKGKEICKERIEELRKKIRMEYKIRNQHEAFIRKRDERFDKGLDRKELKEEKRIIQERLDMEIDRQYQHQLEKRLKRLKNYQ